MPVFLQKTTMVMQRSQCLPGESAELTKDAPDMKMHKTTAMSGCLGAAQRTVGRRFGGEVSNTTFNTRTSAHQVMS